MRWYVNNVNMFVNFYFLLLFKVIRAISFLLLNMYIILISIKSYGI